MSNENVNSDVEWITEKANEFYNEIVEYVSEEYASILRELIVAKSFVWFNRGILEELQADLLRAKGYHAQNSDLKGNVQEKAAILDLLTHDVQMKVNQARSKMEEWQIDEEIWYMVEKFYRQERFSTSNVFQMFGQQFAKGFLDYDVTNGTAKAVQHLQDDQTADSVPQERPDGS